MDGEDDTTARLRSVRERLRTVNNELIDLRSIYWAQANERAALAVDSARHGISFALHDLQRCDHEPPKGNKSG